jgi:hypothetical protein
VKSSIGQIEEFKKSFIWQDICNELDVWLEQIRDELEGAEGIVLYRLQGNAESLRNVKNILDSLVAVSSAKMGD